MVKKLKKVFSLSLDPGYRNYTIRDIIDLKGKKKLTQICVNTAKEAAAAEEAGIDIILIRFCPEIESIRRAAPKTFMTASVPFIKYSDKRDAIKDCLEIISLGLDSLTCGSWNLNFMKYLNQFKIPFQGHAGLVPRKSTWIGGVKGYGKTYNEAVQLFKDIKDIEDTGAWGVETECVPEEILDEITKKTSLVTISIGSGKKADVQFLFAEDILGHSSIPLPRHAKKYRNFEAAYNKLQKERILAFKEFKRDVLKGSFPQKRNNVKVDKIHLKKFQNYLKDK